MTHQQRQKYRAQRGRIYHTETFGTVDGPGIRFVVFMQGCALRCLYCHNPDSISINGGENTTAGDITDKILCYRSYIKNGGVTFSGGEPLLQPKFVAAVELLLLEQGITSVIDTAGAHLTSDVKEAVNKAKLILLDIKAFTPEVAVKLTGRDNSLSFAMLDYCESNNIPVWIRHVLLRGYTLEETELKGLAKNLVEYNCIKKIELLPFHKIGEPKWNETNYQYKLADVAATTKEETQWASEFFRKQGHIVQ